MLHSSRKSTWRRAALLIISTMLVMTFLAACGSKETKSEGFTGAGEGTVIATYKDGNVTDPEFNKYLAVFNIMQPGYEQIIAIPQFKEQLLQQFVSYKILGNEASKESLKEARKEVDAQIKEYKAALKDNAELKAQVDEKKVTVKDMDAYLMLTSAVVAHMNSKVTDDDIKVQYDTKGANLATATLRQILVATMETDAATQEQKELRTSEEALKIAQEVKAKLNAGGDWDAIAKEYSDDPGSKEKGGLYSDVKNRDFVEEFKEAVYTQEVGVIGEPVESQFGYHVILVEKREITPFDKLTDEEKQSLKSAAAYEHMNTFMKDELAGYDIKITLPEAEAPKDEVAPETDAPTAEESPAPTDAPATK